MNEVPLGNVVYSDFIELVVKHDARPERPDDEEAPTLSDAIWEVAEKCWVKDPRKRPTASATCDIVSRLLGTNAPLLLQTKNQRTNFVHAVCLLLHLLN